ncbi:hypothetical protein AB205_0016360 [Aquarana catesbeiana]|uniref:Uncharacterized protein n=1 Tax=Aquarana catesbeiana TaxID=8400 RepID=A0A2G9SG38_AQUCT|nr:hypothetical protein AB205_0016360 [Aquarana catesbeiana]
MSHESASNSTAKMQPINCNVSMHTGIFYIHLIFMELHSSGLSRIHPGIHPADEYSAEEKPTDPNWLPIPFITNLLHVGIAVFLVVLNSHISSEGIIPRSGVSCAGSDVIVAPATLTAPEPTFLEETPRERVGSLSGDQARCGSFVLRQVFFFFFFFPAAYYLFKL